MKTVCKKLLCLMLVAMLLVSAVPAAFAAPLTTEVKCPVCGEVATYHHGGNRVDATCTTGGKECYKCANDECTGSDYFLVDSPALGHKWEDASVEPTCTTAGFAGNECTVCGEKDGDPVTRGHNYVGGYCTHCDEPDPSMADKDEVKNVTFTIFEVDADNNAKSAGEKTVNVNAYASEYELVKAIYGSSKFQDYKLNIDRGTLYIYALKSENGKAVYQLKVMHNNGTSDYTLIDVYEDEGVLAAIKAAGIKMKQHVDGDEYKLMGYSTKMTTDNDPPLYNYSGYIGPYTKASELTVKNGVITVYADWRATSDDDDEDYEYGNEGGLYGDDNDDPIYDVVLYIYTNGKTSGYAKKINASAMGVYTKDGVLTRDEVQIVVEKYFKTNSDTKYYGLFNTYYWNDGNYLTENAQYSIKLDPDETNNVYVMVKNATAYVADSTNPKTGDYITVAATTMVLAAAALVSMVELKKRKLI